MSVRYRSSPATGTTAERARPSQLKLHWAAEPTTTQVRRADPAHQRGLAESLYLARFDEAMEPYSLQWFLTVEAHRYDRRGAWLPELLEFSKHAGETVLGLGEGLGTDWLQFAKQGAKVVCCQAKSGDLSLVRKNFELRGVAAQFLQAAPAHLPLPSASVDVVCINGLLHRQADPTAVAVEIERVLKPGGKVLGVVPARSYPWLNWLRSSSPPARERTFSRRQLRHLFPTFLDHRIHKRHLRRRDYLWLCRWLPRPILERLIGEFFVLRAFKPVAQAALRLAA